MSKQSKESASFTLEACPLCDGTMKEILMTDYPRPTSPKVIIHNVICGMCDTCGEKFFNATQLRDVERKTNEALRQAKQYLTADEISCFLEKLSQQTHLSESRLAEAFGVTRQELHRWKTSERIQSPTAESFLRFASEDLDRFADFVRARINAPKRGRPRKAGAF